MKRGRARGVHAKADRTGRPIGDGGQNDRVSSDPPCSARRLGRHGGLFMSITAGSDLSGRRMQPIWLSAMSPDGMLLIP